MFLCVLIRLACKILSGSGLTSKTLAALKFATFSHFVLDVFLLLLLYESLSSAQGPRLPRKGVSPLDPAVFRNWHFSLSLHALQLISIACYPP